jgi:hypothetical protein
MHNFVNCSYYHITIVYPNFEQLHHEMENDNSDVDDDDVEQDDLASGTI